MSESSLSLESLLLLTEQSGNVRLPAAAAKVAVETARAEARPAAFLDQRPLRQRQQQLRLRPHHDTEGGKQMPHAASVHCPPSPLLLVAVIHERPHLVSVCAQRWQRDDLG
jgi:hypothetical protein